MNSLQRVMAAIKFQPVDKIPVGLHNFQMCALWSGIDFDLFYKNGEAMANSQIDLWNKFRHDAIFLENGTAALAEALGCEVIYRKDQPPAVGRPLLHDISEVDSLKRLPEISECPILCENLKATNILAKQFGNQVFIMGRGDQGPFSLAALLLGMDNLLMEIAMGENNDMVHKLLNYCTDFIIKYCSEQIKHGAVCTSIGDSTAGPDVVSPETYGEFALPYEKIIVDAVHEIGGLFSLHICGNATKITDKMILTGADILEIDEKTDLVVAKSIAEGKAALLGQVSPGTTRFGKPEDVKNEAVKSICIMGKNTGFILGAGCALASDTPDENIYAMINARDY